MNLLGKMKPSDVKALAINDIKTAGTFLLKCLDN